MSYDTDLTDWELMPSDERTDAAWYATMIHAKLHPHLEPAECDCYLAWRRNPSFAGLRRWLRDTKQRAHRRLAAHDKDAA